MLSKIPKYHSLANQLRGKILRGEFMPGERLQTEHEFASEMGVSRQTVRQAIGILESEGLLVRVRGSGTYIKNTQSQQHRNTMTVGVVSTYIREYLFPDLIGGMERELSAAGYAMTLSVTQNRVDTERRLLKGFIENPPDGLIVEGTKSALPNPNLPLYKQLEAMDVPVVFLHGFYSELNPNYIVMDDREGGRQAVRYLMEKGHRKICGLFKSDDRQGLERYGGFVEELTQADLLWRDESIVWFTTANREELISQTNAAAILRAVGDSTAAVCYNDEVAVALLEILRENGRRVPQDIALISFDNSSYSERAAVKITSLHHPKEAMGREAVRKLLRMIAKQPDEPMVMDWVIVPKESV